MNASRRQAKHKESRRFIFALARIIDHYLPDEKTHYCSCSPAGRKTHIYRDLLTVHRTLLRWGKESK